MQTFADFGLHPAILKALEKMNFKEPSPIQSQTLPHILDNRDLIALAQTGSGKTAACAIPICNRVNIHQPCIQALIIVPTRELALQYATETQKIGAEMGVRAFALYGGEDMSLQQAKLKHGVHVLIATPGRLIDLIYSRSIDLTEVNTLILDEADEMLSMGFYDDIEFVIQCLIHDHQTLLFSATMPKEIRAIAAKHMKDPVEIVLTTTRSTPASIEHHFAYGSLHDRDKTLQKIIEELKPKQAIVFCRSRIQVENVCRTLKKSFDGVDFLHAGLSQDVRTIITGKFRSARIKILVATDVAARGLDFTGITHVFIYQLSEDADAYIHRAGRTGRYERTGVVVTLVTHRELPFLEKVLKRIEKEPLWIGPPPDLSQKPKHTPSKKPRRFPPCRKPNQGG